MASIARLATLASPTLALFVLAACATQPPEPPPEPDPPTVDIWTAASAGNLAELEAHKHAGTDLDGQDPSLQITPLTSAVVGDQADAAQWLLDNGAGVDGTNGDGSTALNAAAFLGRADVAKVLIDGGIDTSVRNWEGQSAADIAQLDWNTTEYIAAMLQLDVDRETVAAGRAEIIAMIGGTAGTSSGSGFEELASAIINDQAAAVKAALAGGADVNSRNPDLGSTPLIVAAFLGRAEIAKMLLVAGADIHAMDNNGTTAVTVAELDWQTTQDIAAALQIPLTNPGAIKKGKAEIAAMLRAKM